MANDTIKIIGKDGLIDATGLSKLDKLNTEIKELDANFNKLGKTLNANEKEFKDLAKLQQKAIVNSGNDAKKILELTEASKKLNDEYKKNVKAQQDLIKEQEKLAVVKKKAVTLTLQEKEAAKETLKVDRLVAKSKNQVKGSVEELRTRLSLITLSWSKLSEKELENSKRGQRLVKSKKDLTSQLKKLEKATGDNRREVGNYSGALNDAANEAGLFGGSLGTAIRILKIARTNLLAFTTSLGGFRLALLSTGIGAIVVALGSLITFLTKSQKGIDLMNQAFAFTSQIADEVIDVVISMGESIFEAFSNPKKAIKDLGDAIVTNVVNRFKGIALIGDAIVKLFDDFTDTQAWVELGDAVTQTTTGISNASEKAEAAAKKIAEIASNAAADSQEAIALEKRRQDLEKRRIKFIVRQAELVLAIQDARKDVENSEKTITERIEANNKALELTKVLEGERVAFAQENLSIILRQNELAESLNEDLEAAANAEKDLLVARTASAKKQATLLARQKALNAELNKTVSSEEKITKEIGKQLANVEKLNDEQDESFKNALANNDTLTSLKEKHKQEADKELETIKARKELEEEVLGTIIDQGTAMTDNKLAADILNIALKAALNNILAGGSGNIFAGGGAQAGQQSATSNGFAHGGYTGDGGKFEEAGTVHKGEYVIDKETTSALGMKGMDMNTLSRALETAKVNNQLAQGKSLAIALAPQPASVPEPINYELLGKEVGKNMPKHDFKAFGDHMVQTTEKYKHLENVVYKSKSASFRPKQIQNSVW